MFSVGRKILLENFAGGKLENSFHDYLLLPSRFSLLITFTSTPESTRRINVKFVKFVKLPTNVQRACETSLYIFRLNFAAFHRFTNIESHFPKILSLIT